MNATSKAAIDVFDEWAATGCAEGMEKDPGAAMREALKDIDFQPGQSALNRLEACL